MTTDGAVVPRSAPRSDILSGAAATTRPASRSVSRISDDEFEAFVRRRRGALLRTAIALTAGDEHLAEDVVQTTLIRLYLAWGRARRTQIDAYARRTLVNVMIDETRRPHRREQPTVVLPDGPAPAAETALDDMLLLALRAVPLSMRTAVVLRHVEGLTVEEAAAAMGCSTGNVKSQSARGLERLRRALDTIEAGGTV